MSSRRSKRTSSLRKLCSQAKVRSTTQRSLPRPEPCSVPRRAISGLIPLARTADGPAHSRDRFDQGHELGYVVAVAARERPRQRDALDVGEDVVLGARSCTVDRARARRGTPFLAWMWLESTTARDQSSAPSLGS